MASPVFIAQRNQLRVLADHVDDVEKILDPVVVFRERLHVDKIREPRVAHT